MNNQILSIEDGIAVLKDADNYLNANALSEYKECKGRVAQRIEPLFDVRGDAGSSMIRKSRRAHTDLPYNTKEKIKEKQAHSLDKARVRRTRILNEFFLDYGNCRNQHTLINNSNNNYINFSVQSDIFFGRIIPINILKNQRFFRVLEKQGHGLMIENTHNFIANNIIAYNNYLAASSSARGEVRIWSS